MIPKRIKNNINTYRKVKYQKILFSKNDLKLRNKAIHLISSFESKTQEEKDCCKSCEFYTNKLNDNNFISFYKKFSANLQLKQKYNLKTFKKLNNKNACFKSYIIFSRFLMRNKRINRIQKLNTLLKINDLLILMFEKNKHLDLVKNFKQNIKYEKKLINLYL